MKTANKFQEQETNRLLLRRLVETDWEMISYLRTDKEVNKYVNRRSAETKEKALAFIARTNSDINNGRLYQWCISLKDSPAMIGNICLWNFSPDYKTAEMGYDLSPKFQGLGYMTEAVIKVLDFGFHNVHLDKIEAFTNYQNERSKKLLLKTQFIRNEQRKDPDDGGNLIYEVYKEHYLSNL